MNNNTNEHFSIFVNALLLFIAGTMLPLSSYAVTYFEQSEQHEPHISHYNWSWVTRDPSWSSDLDIDVLAYSITADRRLVCLGKPNSTDPIDCYTPSENSRVDWSNGKRIYCSEADTRSISGACYHIRKLIRDWHTPGGLTDRDSQYWIVSQDPLTGDWHCLVNAENSSSCVKHYDTTQAGTWRDTISTLAGRIHASSKPITLDDFCLSTMSADRCNYADNYNSLAEVWQRNYIERVYQDYQADWYNWQTEVRSELNQYKTSDTEHADFYQAIIQLVNDATVDSIDTLHFDFSLKAAIHHVDGVEGSEQAEYYQRVYTQIENIYQIARLASTTAALDIPVEAVTEPAVCGQTTVDHIGADPLISYRFWLDELILWTYLDWTDTPTTPDSTYKPLLAQIIRLALIKARQNNLSPSGLMQLLESYKQQLYPPLDTILFDFPEYSFFISEVLDAHQQGVGQEDNFYAGAENNSTLYYTDFDFHSTTKAHGICRSNTHASNWLDQLHVFLHRVMAREKNKQLNHYGCGSKFDLYQYILNKVLEARAKNWGYDQLTASLDENGDALCISGWSPNHNYRSHGRAGIYDTFYSSFVNDTMNPFHPENAHVKTIVSLPLMMPWNVTKTIGAGPHASMEGFFEEHINE